GTPASEKIWPSVLKSVLRGSAGGRTSPCRCGCRAIAGTLAGSALRRPRWQWRRAPRRVPCGTGGGPKLVGAMGRERRPHRAGGGAGGDLEGVAVAVDVMGDHVENINALHTRFR